MRNVIREDYGDVRRTGYTLLPHGSALTYLKAGVQNDSGHSFLLHVLCSYEPGMRILRLSVTAAPSAPSSGCLCLPCAKRRHPEEGVGRRAASHPLLRQQTDMPPQGPALRTPTTLYGMLSVPRPLGPLLETM